MKVRYSIETYEKLLVSQEEMRDKYEEMQKSHKEILKSREEMRDRYEEISKRLMRLEQDRLNGDSHEKVA